MTARRLQVAGLFAGVGGIELGFQAVRNQRQQVFETSLLCESWDPAREVLARRFPEVPLVGDISQLKGLPPTDVVVAGFPCTDLSQAGRTMGIGGTASGLVFKALDLIASRMPSWLVLENVPNMLHLERGRAMSVITSKLEDLGYDWAYRVIDSRSVGLPQRRRRVFLVAARDGRPERVLFRDSYEPRTPAEPASAYGFYWTEGNRGLGWAPDAVPPLKGGSTSGIPSPPAVWLRHGEAGCRIVRPSIEAAEVLQGLRKGWTSVVDARSRWKLVGNAVTVGVARWIAEGIARQGAQQPGLDGVPHEPLQTGMSWPSAACRIDGKLRLVQISDWPSKSRYRHLADVLNTHGSEPLSLRATTGFRDRLARSRLKYEPKFMAALNEHVALMSRHAR